MVSIRPSASLRFATLRSGLHLGKLDATLDQRRIYMPKDRPTKGETTRIAIEDAAMNLFLTQGYAATSMRQIAEEVGLALG